jgi:hypothetical protein
VWVHDLTFRSKVKVPRRSLRYVTPPYGHAPTFVFWDRSVIFGMWVHDHKAVCRSTMMTFVGIWRLTSRSNNCFLNSIYLVCGCMTIRQCVTYHYDLRENNYLTLRSKVKVPRRSLWYVTHHLMIMHPHTKYNWPIWKDKIVMVQTSFAEKKMIFGM